MRKLNQGGVSMIELLIAAAILGALASTVMVVRTFVAKQTVSNTDKTYGTQKALQMFEELKALVRGNEKAGINVLDQYADTAAYNTVLTTDKTVDTGLAGANPGDPLSGNRQTNGHWRYMRNVLVKRVADDPYARQVFIKVWRYASDSDPSDPGELLAEVGGVLRTISNVFNPTQVMDVYVLALSTIPGWFTAVPQMQSTFRQVVTDLQTRNPGLEIRAHFITQTGFGRDPLYKPYVNVAKGTDEQAMPDVYFYPGYIAHSDLNFSPYAGPQTFFSATQMTAIGNALVDGSPSNGNGTGGFSISDMYNADLRYPDELLAYAGVTAQANWVNTPEITLRMLLEGMNTDPTDYQNALVISMHGEVLPLVPMRNYSDPAKDPDVYPNVRLVTHPTEIHYQSGNAVTLRVYGYYDGLDLDGSGNLATLDGQFPADTSGNNTPALAIGTIYFPDMGTGNGLSVGAVSCVYGGYENNVAIPYGITALSSGATDPVTMNMSWGVSQTASSTCITIFNTPLRCNQVVSAGVTTGLPVTNRLYETEYIPCPVEGTFANYSPNLVSTGAKPKNTARWIITLNGVPDGQHAVETRLGNALTQGGYNYASVSYNPHPENLSRTYIWMGTGTGIPGQSTCGTPPWTERFQFNGDPRDEPYEDVKFGGGAVSSVGGIPSNIESDGYNWYFKNISGTTDGYSGYSQSANGYSSSNDRDIPRFYYTYRRGILLSHAIYTNLNGYSFWHAGEGGEFGDTYDPFKASLPFIDTPWVPTDTVGHTMINVNEIQGSNGSSKFVNGSVSGSPTTATYGSPPGATTAMDVIRDHSGNAISRWHAYWWRGEMFPDDVYDTDWVPYGNLRTNVGASGHFYRIPKGAVTMVSGNTTDGFVVGRYYGKDVGGLACAAFMDGNSDATSATGNYFMHTTSGTQQYSDLYPLANSIATIFNFPMDSPVSCTRAWTSNFNAASFPPEWSSTYYSAVRTKLSIPSVGVTQRLLYDSQIIGVAGPNAPATWNGVGVMRMDSHNGSDSAFFNISGLAPQANTSTESLAETALVMALRTYLDGGLYTGSAHIPQLSLLKIYVDSLTAQYFQPSVIHVALDSPVTTGNSLTVSPGFIIPSGPLPNPWFRFQGLDSSVANYYTDEYTSYGYPNLLSNSYAETVAGGAPMTMDVNIKFSKDNEKTWYFADSPGTQAQKGIYDSGHNLATTTTFPITWDWDVSDTNQYPQQDYLLMAEIYREGYPQGYSYHILDISIDR